MDKPSKLNERLTLIANIAVVGGIVFLALEMRQNTNMMRAQIRDSITGHQLEYLGMAAVNPELAVAVTKGNDEGPAALSRAETYQYQTYVTAQLREWENSFYQFENGLFAEQEFEARTYRWRRVMTNPGGEGEMFRGLWAGWREGFAPDFRAEIDAIVAEIEGQ